MRPVVHAEWLVAHRDEVVVCDVRWYLDGRSGRAEYEKGHVPGAVFVDLDTCLAAPPSPEAGRHPLPSAEAFADCIGRLGVGDHTTVVAYDDQGGAIAARLVWMLRVTGHLAALLDGGILAWSGPLESATPSVTRARFTTVPWPATALVDAAAVAVATAGRTAVVVDARAPERYSGDVEPIDPRAGHIPAAVNIPHTANVDPETGCFLPPERLRVRYEKAGVVTGLEVIAYCGSGVTACHDLLALEVAGLGPGRLYPGSWSQWSADPTRPAATGPA